MNGDRVALLVASWLAAACLWPAPSLAVRFDGADGAPAARATDWRQLYFEQRAASPLAASRPELEALQTRARNVASAGSIPIALLDLGAAPRAEDPTPGRAFAAAALVDHTYRGTSVSFVLDPGLFITDDPAALVRLECDFGDGLGFRAVGLGSPVPVSYRETGTKTVTLRLALADGAVRTARFAFEVRALATPTPDDTLHVTGTIPFRGAVASGDAYVRLAPGHTGIVNPVVVPEGFDLDNSMNWDELYALLNQQGLADSLNTLGYDAIVLNFADATDWIERNAFVLVELLQQVQAGLPPNTTIAMVGPSMGGLIGRYALAWMEQNVLHHRVRTFISFDTPHDGANIPLGIQYWVKFFSGQSAAAAFLLERLNTPAARQMLVYRHSDPPSSTPGPDSVRAVLEADLAAVGGYPALTRRVAIANGSGSRANQGFNAADQIIRYDYNIVIVRILGNVWAVPDGNSARIFDGRIYVFLTTDQTLQVTVSGTKPYDNAPGGSRATMTQMDTTAAPYGDIVALHPSHCFIPTVSALDVATGDLFYDVAGDANLLAHTPFDAVYFPVANQGHVTVTPENKAWLLYEIQLMPLGVGDRPGASEVALEPPAPNPLGDRTLLRFRLPRATHARLAIYSVDGREIARLVDGPLSAGDHLARWEARDAVGRGVAPGVYFARLEAGGWARTQRLVVLR